MTSRPMERRRPRVDDAREFLEITRDFIDPRDAIREAISNSIDWGATEVRIAVTEDRSRPDEELIIEIEDDGVGLTEERLDAFFGLARSTAIEPEEPRRAAAQKIGYKGHGTKTYFNSRQIEVFSDSAECTVYAIMDSPLHKLMNDEVPEYDCDIERKTNEASGTRVKICGYNMNQNKRDFAHDVLRDYVLWFTKFGAVEGELGVTDNAEKVLLLKGLGQDQFEPVAFGHPFAPENCDLDRLMQEAPGEWTKVFVKRWVFPRLPIVDYPGKFIDMVFYIEGDAAKRSYNPMIRVRGRTPEYGMYKVEDRFGLWVCKDCIPIKRRNEWLGLGKRLETKYHAFVNCQEFRLTANRGDVGNTPPDLLKAIEQTVRGAFEDQIIGSSEYQEYDEAAELEEQYQTAYQERRDFDRRTRRAATKRVCHHGGVDLIEPGVEMGVVALFNQVYSLEPSLFPFRVIDYDTKRGYDALVTQSSAHDLAGEPSYFVEFKYMLTPEFNHAFGHLAAIICWDCDLSDGAHVVDIQGSRRELRVTPPASASEHTCYMLQSGRGLHNIQVFVLKDYLREKLGLEFRPRTSSA